MNVQSISTSSPPPQSSLEASLALRESKSVKPVQEKAIAEPSVQTAQPSNQEQLKAAVQSVREYVQPFNSNLEFSISDETKSIVIKIVDVATKEVIRQIPSEEMIAMAKALDNIKGLFIKQMA